MNSSTTCWQPDAATYLLAGIRGRGMGVRRFGAFDDVRVVHGFGPDAGTPKGVHLEEEET